MEERDHSVSEGEAGEGHVADEGGRPEPSGEGGGALIHITRSCALKWSQCRCASLNWSWNWRQFERE